MSADPHPLRILIVRLTAIGDVIHGLPVLCALRERFPKAFIGWVVEGRCGELLQGHQSLDRLIVVRRKWLKSPSAVLGLRRELKSLKFGVAIDMQCLTKSAIAARLSGARRRIGFSGPDGRELSPWLHDEFVEPTATHVIDRNLELLKPLGIEQPEVRFEVPDDPDANAKIGQWIEQRKWRDGFAVINPGAGWPSKVWPTARFAAVAAHLGSAWNLPSVVVWAGDDERRWAEEIVAGSDGKAVLASPTSLRELAALLRRAQLFVGSDTGPLHLAAALNTPCVGLFGPMPAERNGPYGSKHIAIQNMCLSGSSRERRTAGPESMAAIPADQVAAACDQILKRSGGSAQAA